MRVLKRKQGERTAELARLQNHYKLGLAEQGIIDLTWDDLVKGLQSRKLTATRVLEAYIAKVRYTAQNWYIIPETGTITLGTGLNLMFLYYLYCFRLWTLIVNSTLSQTSFHKHM